MTVSPWPQFPVAADIPVPTADNDGIWALAGGQVEHIPHLTNSDKGSAEEIGRQGGGVVHALDGNIELGLQLVGKRWSDSLSL